LIREGRGYPVLRRRAGKVVYKADKGFTLLELLISITLLATIVTIATGALRLGYRSISSGEKRMESMERFRSSLYIINAQILSGAPLSFVQQGVKKVYFAGSSDFLRLATNYSIWGGQRGYVIVEYRIALENDGRKSLYASESMIGTEKQRETKLLQGLDGIYFEYFLTDKTQEQGGEWVEQWSDTTKVPEKLRLNLIQGRKEISMIIPMRAQGLTQARLEQIFQRGAHG
jgi:prepilin-type N-terminal cleavage/methylation domain-containing protein